MWSMLAVLFIAMIIFFSEKTKSERLWVPASTSHRLLAAPFHTSSCGGWNFCLFTEITFPLFQLFCHLNCFPGDDSLLSWGGWTSLNFTVKLTSQGHWVLFLFVLKLHLEAFEKDVMLTIAMPTLLGRWATRHIRNYYSCGPFRCECGVDVLA